MINFSVTQLKTCKLISSLPDLLTFCFTNPNEEKTLITDVYIIARGIALSEISAGVRQHLAQVRQQARLTYTSLAFGVPPSLTYLSINTSIACHTYSFESLCSDVPL